MRSRVDPFAIRIYTDASIGFAWVRLDIKSFRGRTRPAFSAQSGLHAEPWKHPYLKDDPEYEDACNNEEIHCLNSFGCCCVFCSHKFVSGCNDLHGCSRRRSWGMYQTCLRPSFPKSANAVITPEKNIAKKNVQELIPFCPRIHPERKVMLFRGEISHSATLQVEAPVNQLHSSCRERFFMTFRRAA